MNIVITGVGGQGSLLTSQILGALFIQRGQEVKVNEVHGMSQRGGNVVTMVRAGERVHSPLVAPGQADLLIGLEMIETLRGLSYLAPEGKVVASTQVIWPVSAPRTQTYTLPPRTIAVDAVALAKQAGNERAANTALLGAASKVMDFSREEWHQAIQAAVKPKTLEVNLTAFGLGAG